MDTVTPKSRVMGVTTLLASEKYFEVTVVRKLGLLMRGQAWLSSKEVSPRLAELNVVHRLQKFL